MENLELIDWVMVGLASLWITGLALILTALGFADYRAARAGGKFRHEIKRPAYQSVINFGLNLFCLGMVGSSREWWQTVLWAVLAAAFAAYTFRALRQMRRDKKD